MEHKTYARDIDAYISREKRIYRIVVPSILARVQSNGEEVEETRIETHENHRTVMKDEPLSSCAHQRVVKNQ